MYRDTLRETLPAVREQIAEAASRVGRDPESVTLVAVTKKHPLEALDAAVEAGIHDLGENRVSEMEEKFAARPELDARWHMIGHVQSRKAPRLIGVADLVHSVDSLKLAERLSRKLEEGQEIRVLAQVNTSGEDAKSGFERGRAAEAVLAIAEVPGVRVEGLMTMAPFVEEEAVLRSCFSRLRELLGDVRGHDPEIGEILSMGMTNDLRYAVEEGSTMVRVGTALFGPRPGTEG